MLLILILIVAVGFIRFSFTCVKFMEEKQTQKFVFTDYSHCVAVTVRVSPLQAKATNI